MPENTKKDTTDDGTLRPDLPPIRVPGDNYNPMLIPDFDLQISLPNGVNVNHPLSLFLLYYPPEIVKHLVDCTNDHVQDLPEPTERRSRAKAWFPTSIGEIYIYFAIRIYMTRHPENKVTDYWKSNGLVPYHPISKAMGRDRFQALYKYCRWSPITVKDIYEKVSKISEHIQRINLQLWQPGRDLAIDEAIARFTGRAHEITTIPNKPTPTGLKIWCCAQKGFMLTWCWHRPGGKHGPVGVKTPIELGGSINGKGGNKTQAVVPHLLHKLPPASYHVFLDNLFTSTNLFELLRQEGFAATGTCRKNAGVVQPLIDKKDEDKGKTELQWGTQIAYPTPSGNVLQTGWKDNAFALTMTTFFTGKEEVIRERKRPRESSSKAKTARKPFGNKPTKKLPVPEIYDEYNHHMGDVDRADQLRAHNQGLRPIRRGAAKVIDQFLLTTVLVNIYQVAVYSKKGDGSLKLTSQDHLRDKLINDLLELGERYKAPRKRKISGPFGPPILEAPNEHHHVKLLTRRDCAACKGIRFSDRPPKRVALGEIAANAHRKSVRKTSIWGCKECDVALCKKSSCFAIYHGIE